MPVEERSLTSGMLLEETNSPEIGICLSTPLRTRRSRKELYSSAKLGMFSESRPMRDRPIVCWRVKPVGEPCAGNPHARFDERECGNGAWHAAIEARTGKPRHGTMPKPTPPRHLSTLPHRSDTGRVANDGRMSVGGLGTNLTLQIL